MTGKQTKKKSFKRRLLRLLIPAALIAYGAAVIVDMQIGVSQKQRELENIRARVESQRLDNAELERMLTMGLDEEYIERYARDYLGYVSPDQQVFIDISGS
ncbi:MAG: septum formation initiator family protein [Oscillospiraceae bacterium]|nr:septum formation initiator family protein [Oscillospiraceae bacterium]